MAYLKISFNINNLIQSLMTVPNTHKNNLYQNMKLYDDKKGEIMI